MQLLDLTLTALADPTRRGIVERLSRGTATVSELVDSFELTQPTISSHLKVLERSGLISRSRVAQTRPCRLEPEGLRALDAWLGQLRSVFEANYARLDRVLEELKDQEGEDPDPMKPLELTTPTPTSTRIVRSFDARLALVWRAHTEPELVKQWATGPPDHSLVACEIDFRVGGSARYVWKNPQFEMGMTAAFLEIALHERIVHTEDYDGWPEGKSTVTTTFVEAHGRTTVTLDIQYQTREARDAAMQPGFAEGYEASYTQLDTLVQELQVDS